MRPDSNSVGAHCAGACCVVREGWLCFFLCGAFEATRREMRRVVVGRGSHECRGELCAMLRFSLTKTRLLSREGLASNWGWIEWDDHYAACKQRRTLCAVCMKKLEMSDL